jgi:hypothetical protein
MFKRYTDEQKREASSALGLLSGFASQCPAAMNHINCLAVSQGGFDEATYGYMKAEIDWVMVYYRRGVECAQRMGVREDSATASRIARSLGTFFQLTDPVLVCQDVGQWHLTCKHACRDLSDIAQYNPKDWNWW